MVFREKINGKGKTVAQINEVLCKGCGACFGACFSEALQQNGFTGGQILSAIKTLGKK